MMIQSMLAPAESRREDSLVCAAAEGDRGAFGELYARYARMVHGILLSRVPPAEAEDLVHDVFVSALERLRGLRSASAFRGWLAAIARNRAIDYFRDARRWTVLHKEDRTERRATRSQAGALLILDAVRNLPEAYSETLLLRLVEGLTGPEIARQTGLTPESVRVNLCRGMKMLRELLRGKESL